jgi:phage terminase small subunit
MTREARAVWDELAPILTRAGVLTEMDGPALAHLCNLEANRRELVKLKDRFRGPDDEVLRLKVMVEERKLSPALAVLYGRFGMTPSERSKVTVEPKKPESKLAGFLGG